MRSWWATDLHQCRRPEANPHASGPISLQDLRRENPTKNPTHQRNSDEPDRLGSTRLPIISRHKQQDQHFKTIWNPLLINRFRVQVPAGAPKKCTKQAHQASSIEIMYSFILVDPHD